MSFKPVLVAIVGGSCAGKSRLASELQRLLGKEAARLCLDDFYLDRSHLSRRRRERLNFDHPRSIDWAELERVLDSVCSGRRVDLPVYHFASHARAVERIGWRPRPVVLADGLWLLRRLSIRKRFGLKIYLDCPESVRLERRLARDSEERGREAKAIREQFARMVAPMHARYVAPQIQWADIVFRGPLQAAEVIQLAEHVRGLLREEVHHE
jgi:uridine kinase